MSTYYYCDNTKPETVTLHNGRSVQIRSICKDDSGLEKELFEGLSAESRRDRFIGGSSKASQQLLDTLTANDHDVREALIAIANTDTGPHAVGVAHYACDPDGMACECAVVVSDDWQGQGLGSMLLQRLVDTAQSHGLDLIYSIDSADNHRISRLAKALGFDCKADPRDYTLLTYSKYLHPDYLVSKEAAAKRQHH